MHVYYIDLKNDAQNSFLLAHINQLIDATVGNELLSFLDAYFGYNKNWPKR